MSYVYYNPNPKNNRVGDCVIRAITKALNSNWNDIYLDIVAEGFEEKDMPSSDNVWGRYLFKKGFRRNVIPNDCPDCYTIRDFSYDHPHGTYILVTSERNHIVCMDNGTVYDTFDSLNEVPVYYWRREY